MKRSAILSLLLFFVAIVCDAQPITRQQAEQKARTFMKQRGMSVERGVSNVPLSQISVGESPIYVFNAVDGQGFVIVSGDERTEEILGYGTDCHFDEKKLSEPMREWLTGYSTQINELQKGRMKTKPMKVSAHEAIGKMVSSVWNQGVASASGNAYNQLCPTFQGKHCVTGCVATAMAQVMRYHEWPKDYCCEIPGYTPKENIGYVSSLPQLQFDWSHMLDRYNGGQDAQECTAVAQLMQYCGSALKMNYDTGTSLAYIEDVAMALRTYFDYDVNTRFVCRSDYSAESWDNLIYNELKNGRPVVYNGYKKNTGHAFVCDGYDGNGFYHINWGWGGYCNGYFKLTILNPATGGTGGGNSDGGYSLEQGAIVGIQKPNGTTEEERTLSLVDFYYYEHTIAAQYSNRTGLAGNFDLGFAYLDANASDTTFTIKKDTCPLEPWNIYTYSLDLDGLGLSDGTYHFFPYAILSGKPWFHMIGDYTKYFEVIIRGGKVSTINQHPVGELHIESVECVSSNIVNQPKEIQVTITNEGEEYCGELFLHVSKTSDNAQSFVDDVYLSIEPGGQETTSLYFTPTSTGKWYVWVDDIWYASSGAPSLEIDIIDATITPSDLSVESYDIITNTDAIFKAKIKNNHSTAGYYMPIECYLYEQSTRDIIDYQKTRNMNIAPGETADVEFRFESLEMGKTYEISMGMHAYHNSYEMEWLGRIYSFTVDKEGDPTDIVRITNQASPMDIYSLSGVLLRENATTFEGLPEGIYIVDGRKVVIRK